MTDPCQHLRLSRTIVGETAFYKCSDGWISVTERLPEVGGTYQVWRSFRSPFSTAWDVGHFFILETGPNWMDGQSNAITVTHWQPLPKAPCECCHRNFTAEPLTIKVSYPEPRAEDRQ